MEIRQDVLSSLAENYESAISETKRLINDETHAKVKKSIELKRAAKSKPRKRKHNENKPLDA